MTMLWSIQVNPVLLYSFNNLFALNIPYFWIKDLMDIFECLFTFKLFYICYRFKQNKISMFKKMFPFLYDGS